jgi:AcrR family transcriptional regulator
MTRPLPEETRELLLDRAEYRFWTFGFKKTTIDEIVADAGIGKGSFYQFFESKEALVLATIARWGHQLFEEQKAFSRDAQMSPPEKLRRIITYPILRTYHQYASHPDVQDMIIAVHSDLPVALQPLIEEQVTLVSSVLEEGKREGYFAFADASRTARTLHNITHGFWPPYACVQGLRAIEQALDEVLDLVFQGLTSPPANP